MESAWLKFARAIELSQQLARMTREWNGQSPHEYPSADNAHEHTSRTVTTEWRLKVVRPPSERMGILLGDIIHSFRSALDHAFWFAANTTSGPPADPRAVQFPPSAWMPASWPRLPRSSNT